MSNKTTSLPLVMPNKHKHEMLKGSFGECLTENNHTDLIVKSYRNYYQAKIKQKIHKIDHTIGCGCPACDEGFENKKPKWTKREAPEWLHIC